MGLGAYDVFPASADFADPAWPEVDFKQLVQVAFKDRFIRDMNHPVVRRLRGEM
jgi:hypothetical protein